MKNIVIAGAGPIGLYMAIRLTQIIKSLGLSTTVTLVDPRAGQYDRPGVVANKALDLISQGLKIYIPVVQQGDDTGTSMFIKDMEMSLHKIAVSMGVKIIQGKVEDCDAEKVRVSRPKKEDLMLPCDLALDCTGPRRTLVKLVNAKHAGMEPFTIQDVGDNPIKNHFIAYVTMDEMNAALVSEKKHHDPLKHTLALERLRTEFGWPHFIEPEFSSRRYTIKGTSGQPDRYRYYFYFEIPPSIAEADPGRQLEWLRALIHLKTENENVQFTVDEGKMKFIPFDVYPRKVNEAYSLKDALTPMTAPMGDAQIEPDYRLGVGIWSGVSRANALIESVSQVRDELEFDWKRYEHFVSIPMGTHAGELESDYRIKHEALVSAMERESKRYQEALAATSVASEQEIILQGLNEINRRLAMHLLGKALAAFEKSVDMEKSNRILLNKHNDIIHAHDLAVCLESLTRALAIVPASCTVEKDRVTNALFNLAMSYKQLGNQYFVSRYIDKATTCYQLSLDILERQLKGMHLDEQARIYSNLTQAAIKKNDFDLAVKYANQALELMPVVEMTKKDFFFNKVKYHKCVAMLNKMEAELSRPGCDIQSKQMELRAVTDLYDEFKSSIESKDAEVIDKTLISINKKLKPGKEVPGQGVGYV
ncbi:hypothetical protein AQUSIP_09630 [Aquicella siphonis]|uniref:Uncharacterized protein n=1 Tax=Aquicella siphonis TaxID=254247 RepID=A0A5E4PH36_9COXI|nr:hypothetical protein [Aquicella siphonis]VVC75673.1 hypothetical protein AQUSIP_09630 [Aquicella siphonis]